MLREWRRRPLVADRTANANRYGSIRNYSLLSLLRMTANLFTSKKASVLPGPTDKDLVDPWVAHLLRIGVELHAEREVTALRPVAGRVEVRIGTEALDFDAVVVTAFVPDLAALLTASGMGHRLPDHTNAHCVAFTVDLDLRERVLTGSAPRMYSRGGIDILVQPRHGRCVVLCTTADSTAASEVMPLVRAALSLEYDIVAVRCRIEPASPEAVFVGTYLDPRRILRQRLDTVYFAGSATRNGYPMDSAEGAARTALAAVQRIARDHRLVYAPTSIGRTAGPCPRSWEARRMRTERVAVIGSGVAGCTAAYLLRRRYDVTLFEALPKLGGHADTQEVRAPDGSTVAIDTGFIVHNRVTYPLLSKLFAELGVPVRATDMSMSISCRECGLEYAGGKKGVGLAVNPKPGVRTRYLQHAHGDPALLPGRRRAARRGRDGRHDARAVPGGPRIHPLLH